MSFDQLFKNLSRTCGFWQVASLICFLSERPAPARIRPCALFSLKSSFCLASGCSVQEKYGSISFAQVFPELSTYIQNQNKHLNIVQINCPPNALEPVFNTTHREPFSTCLYIGIIKQQPYINFSFCLPILPLLTQAHFYPALDFPKHALNPVFFGLNLQEMNKSSKSVF